MASAMSDTASDVSGRCHDPARGLAEAWCGPLSRDSGRAALDPAPFAAGGVLDSDGRLSDVVAVYETRRALTYLRKSTS